MSLMQLTARLSLGALLGLAACSKAPAVEIPQGPAPDSFRVALETTRGRIVIQVNRAWAPHGADRVHQLVKAGFFTGNAFYRVVPEFVAQFGASGDEATDERWDALKIPDDSVSHSNVRGTLTFAADGKGSRSHQLFLNLDDNANLDRQGFAPVGMVVEGLGVMDSLYSGYGEQPSYHMITKLGNGYLKRMFPKADFVTSASVSGP